MLQLKVNAFFLPTRRLTHLFFFDTCSDGHCHCNSFPNSPLSLPSHSPPPSYAPAASASTTTITTITPRSLDPPKLLDSFSLSPQPAQRQSHLHMACNGTRLRMCLAQSCDEEDEDMMDWTPTTSPVPVRLELASWGPGGHAHIDATTMR